jgi:cytochrome c oxidase subunit IV
MTAATSTIPRQAHHDHEPHAVPLRVLAGVFAVLMVLTFLTVAATWIDLGTLNIWVALGIAFIKAAFVCLYFMHLRYDSIFYSIVLVCSFLFVVLFMGISMMDTAQYEPKVRAAHQPSVTAPAAPTAPAMPSP